MVIPYRTAKFKSAYYILAILILDSTAKFNSRQCFRLYGMTLYWHNKDSADTLAQTVICMYTVEMNATSINLYCRAIDIHMYNPHL